MTSPSDNEFRGKTVEEATEIGLAALGLKHSQVEVEILSRGSRGLLGFGAEDARVRITRIPAAKRETPVRQEPPASKPAAKPAKPAAPKTETKAAAPAAPAKAAEAPHEPATGSAGEVGELSDAEVGAIAVGLLQGLIDRMDVRATVQLIEYRGALDADQDAPLVLNIEGEDLGILIGRRAETLSALQYLTRLMINHRAHRWVNLIVDVEGYKARREEQLMRLAERMAERVVSTGRAVALEAMPPRERRIVHITLRNHPHVTTQSVGEGDQRKVTIIPRA